MKNVIISVLVLVIILLGAVLLWPTSPSKDLPEASVTGSVVDNQENLITEDQASNQELNQNINLDLTITGFGPGKSHAGTFNDIQISDVKISKEGLPTSGKIIIASDSREYGIDGLEKHLCAPEFLDCEKYPEIIFNLSSLEMISETEYKATGILTFKDTISTITFPVTKSGNEFSADFRLNVKNIGVSYVGIDEEVQVQFTGSIN